MTRSTVGLKTVDLHLVGSMLVPSWFGPERLAMTTVAVSLAAEQFVAALGRFRIEVDSRTRFHCRQGKLIKLKRRQFARDLIMIRIDGYMPKLRARSDRELRGVVQALIKERAYTVHFVYCDEGIPIRDRSPAARPRVQIVPRESTRVGNQGRGRASVWLKGFAIEKQLSIELAWSPTMQDLPDLIHGNSRIGDLKQLLNRSQVRRGGSDRTHIQIMICQPIDPSADPRGYRIIDGGMTDGAGQADRGEFVAVFIEESNHTHHRFFLY